MLMKPLFAEIEAAQHLDPHIHRTFPDQHHGCCQGAA